MATIYELKIKLTSPFVDYPTNELECIIYELIKKYKNKENGLSFESIEVNGKKQTP